MRYDGVVTRLGSDSTSERIFDAAVGKCIKAVTLGTDDALHLELSDGYSIKIRDDGQAYCEHRYMSTDDDIAYYVGATLTGAEIKTAPNIYAYDDEVHEVQFLEVKTSKGVFTMESHVEHNGYYGGFILVVELE